MNTLNPATALQDYIDYYKGALTVEQLAAKYNVSVEDMFNHLFTGKQQFKGL